MLKLSDYFFNSFFIIHTCKAVLKKTIWDSREEAKDFFLESMMLLENEERDRA